MQASRGGDVLGRPVNDVGQLLNADRFLNPAESRPARAGDAATCFLPKQTFGRRSAIYAVHSTRPRPSRPVARFLTDKSSIRCPRLARASS
jgi:hypothetical protein